MYLDTAVLVKLVVLEPDSRHFARLVDGKPACTSEIALVEAHSALLRKEREGSLDPRGRARALRQIAADVADGRLALLAVTRGVIDSARRILEATHPRVALRSLDAIHLASAERLRSWPLCTNDARMRAAAATLALPLCPLP